MSLACQHTSSSAGWFGDGGVGAGERREHTQVTDATYDDLEKWAGLYQYPQATPTHTTCSYMNTLIQIHTVHTHTYTFTYITIIHMHIHIHIHICIHIHIRIHIHIHMHIYIHRYMLLCTMKTAENSQLSSPAVSSLGL